MLHNKGTKSRKLYLIYPKLSRFKRTIKCISNVIYIVNNIVTTRVFVPALVLEQNVLPKFTVTIFIFFFQKYRNISVHMTTKIISRWVYSLLLIKSQNIIRCSIWLKWGPNKKVFKKTSRWKFWKYLSRDFRGFSFFFCLATGFKLGFNGAIL